MAQVQVTIRDLYIPGTDTVTLQGKMADRFRKANNIQRSSMIASLDTVAFTNPYIVKTKWS
jgi:hypothetical protein